MIKRIWKLISMTFTIWADANASRMSAALTYYTMLSLAPLLMIAIAIAGFMFDDQLAESEIVQQVTTVTTPEIAKTIAGLIKSASHPNSGIVAGTISLSILVFAASGVFTQLYDTFNDIWDVSLDGVNSVLFTLQKRLIGVGMVLLVGVLLAAALVLNSAIAYLNSLFEGSYPLAVTWLNLADRGLSFLLMPLVFALVFQLVPATKIYWRDVWPAGILTACLMAASRYLIGLYLHFSTTSEVYGAAGSLAVLLIWVYMSGLVVFLGASFSHAWAETFGSRSDEPADSGETKSVDRPEVENAVAHELPEKPIVPRRRATAK